MSKLRTIMSDNTSVCPFCGSMDIFSGSWSPPVCQRCRSVFFMGSWMEPEPENDTTEAKKIRAAMRLKKHYNNPKNVVDETAPNEAPIHWAVQGFDFHGYSPITIVVLFILSFVAGLIIGTM